MDNSRPTPIPHQTHHTPRHLLLRTRPFQSDPTR
uniref:Uncharacterized protein n=1 Tax=Rhizophora mucronata TaxID=61149 RepID=A0A2P2QC14_RHIMU